MLCPLHSLRPSLLTPLLRKDFDPLFSLESIEARLAHYKKNEALFEESINVLNLEVKLRDNALVENKNKLEKAKKRDELKLTLEKFQNLSKSLNILLESQVIDKFKTGLGYNAAPSTAASPAAESFVNSSEMLENQENYKSKFDKGYHAVPLPYTGNFIPFKLDITFMDEIVKSENIDVVNVVTPSNVKKVKSNHESVDVKNNGDVVEPKTIRKNNFRPPIIEDWNSDHDSEVEFIPNIKDKTVRPSTEKIKKFKSVGETIEKGNPQQKEYKEKGVIDSGCSRHMTGNKCYFTEYEDYDGGFVLFGDGKGRISGKDTECLVLSFYFKLLDESQVLLRVPRKDNNYSVDLKSVVPTKGLTCLFTKAIIDESNLWHRRLRHINFKNMNKLMSGNLVRVVTDDFSRFSWVFFLATKDETSGILKTFITEIENQLDHKVKVIRSDNGTEFKNSVMNQFCEMKGIKREFSVARTPQQNGVAERKNRTLIEAARTMLVDSKLPTTFWAEAVNTACYVLNRVLVIKPHNKTPYELIRGRTPLIDFMKPFGCPVTILNTRDHLGKFDGKADEGFFVGYSILVGPGENWRILMSQKPSGSDFKMINKLVLFVGNPQQKEYKEKGDGKGRISRKGKIKTGTLDCDNVYFCKELKYNLFSVLQICVKKNNVLFTDTECLVLSSDLKLLDESQVLLRVLRKDNIYSVDLKSVIPTKGLTCLLAKARIDESNLWHRRLGHINLKNMNKLVRENLVRGLPSKIFENDHSCVACHKGKQHIVDGIAKRRNRTLIEAARTMLVDSKLPTTFWAEVVNTACYVLNRVLVIKPHNKTPYELIHGRTPLIDFMKPFSKAMRVFNKRTRIVEETLNIRFLENTPNVTGNRPDWLFDVDFLTISMNYVPVVTENQTNGIAGTKDNIVAGQAEKKIEPEQEYILIPFCTTDPLISQGPKDSGEMLYDSLQKTQESEALTDPSWVEAMQEELLQFKLQKVLDSGEKKQSKDWLHKMDVKSAFLYGTIKEEVYVCQPPSFEDPHFPNKVYKVEKALYGLHQAPRAWYETLSTYLIENGFRRGTIDKTLFIKKDKGDILLVQVYVDDIISGSTKKSLCDEFEVQQKDVGIFISQDKYVAEILKKFGFVTVKTTSTPIETNKALVKDEEDEDVDVHLYRSMIGSLMYLKTSRPDIMFAVCACARDSPFDLEAFSDNDYAGASLDRKSTTGRCQFLGKILISWK
ncbi:retrovirus-related pol polyprotein from transposon TNT 1-94 [Tanacetum coccineum]|uniref:Retrovirus-related pol polyprotein from transposon TNT 1-94 n=1 Tax=Tanacetum coccineum TaxID=301880 RepID=A0ABQ4ZP91_9ASTR